MPKRKNNQDGFKHEEIINKAKVLGLNIMANKWAVIVEDQTVKDEGRIFINNIGKLPYEIIGFRSSKIMENFVIASVRVRQRGRVYYRDKLFVRTGEMLANSCIIRWNIESDESEAMLVEDKSNSYIVNKEGSIVKLGRFYSHISDGEFMGNRGYYLYTYDNVSKPYKFISKDLKNQKSLV